MSNEEFTVSEELEQMRTQYAELKARFDKQEIINERLIGASIRKDLRIVSSKKWLSTLAGIFALALLPQVSLKLGLRLPFIIISVVWIAEMIIGNVIRNRRLSVDTLSGESTRKFLDEIKKRKAGQFRWVRVNMSILFLWLGYFIGECIHTGMSKEALIPLLIGVATGGIIGIAAGLMMHNRIIGVYEGIILELENPEVSHRMMR